MVTDKKTEDFFPKQKAFLNKKQNQIPPFTFLLSHLWKAGGGGAVEKNLKDTFGFLPSYQGSNQCKEVGNELDQECLIKLSNH